MEADPFKHHAEYVITRINIAQNSINGFSPCFNAFLEKQKLPIDIILYVHRNTKYEIPGCHKFTQEWTKSMTEAFKILEEYIKSGGGQTKKFKGKKDT